MRSLTYIPEVPNEQKVKEDIENILKVENSTERAIEYMLYSYIFQSIVLFDRINNSKKVLLKISNKMLIAQENVMKLIIIAQENVMERLKNKWYW